MLCHSVCADNNISQNKLSGIRLKTVRKTLLHTAEIRRHLIGNIGEREYEKKNASGIEILKYKMLLVGMVNVLVLSALSGIQGAGYLGISLMVLTLLVFRLLCHSVCADNNRALANRTVDALYCDTILRERLRASLSNIKDVIRISANLALGEIKPKDVLALNSSLHATTGAISTFAEVCRPSECMFY